MSEDELTLLIGAAVIIGVLSIAAIWLWIKVYRLEKAKKQQLETLHKQQQEKHDYIVESIQIIAKNVVSRDLNVSEASIRLKVLLDNLFLPDSERQNFAVIEEVYEQVKYFDTHQARKDLPKEERQRQDKAREKIEHEYHDEIVKTAQIILEYQFPKLH